ncbi:MAG: dihydroneopterin aldolase [Muribaculaceae bacterium]|nr:dihydroneopterin aldolase [Muribaculaceae bacterium]
MSDQQILGRIIVDSLRLSAHHGVFPQEQLLGNEFLVSVELLYPITDAALNDDLDGTINYAEVVGLIRREMATPSRLLEHVAWRIAAALRRRWPAIVSGTLTVAKPTPPIANTQLTKVAVQITV